MPKTYQKDVHFNGSKIWNLLRACVARHLHRFGPFCRTKHRVWANSSMLLETGLLMPLGHQSVATLCTTFPQQKLTRGMKGSTWMTCSMAMELQCMSRPWKLEVVTWSQLPIFFNEVDGSKYTGNFWCDKHHGDGVEAEIASLWLFPWVGAYLHDEKPWNLYEFVWICQVWPDGKRFQGTYHQGMKHGGSPSGGSPLVTDGDGSEAQFFVRTVGMGMG